MDVMLVDDDSIAVVDLILFLVDVSFDFKAPRRVGLSASCLSPCDPTPSGRSVLWEYNC